MARHWWIGKLDTVWRSNLSKFDLQVHCNYNQNPSRNFFFFQVDKLASKTFIWKGKGTSIVKTILQKNEFGMSLLDFKAYYRAAVTIECGIGKRIGLRIDGTEESRNGPTQYDHLITTKNKDNSLCIFGYPYAKNWTWPTHYTQKLTKAES